MNNPVDLLALADQLSSIDDYDQRVFSSENWSQLCAALTAGAPEELMRALCVIGIVGQIDGHDVVRRSSMLEIAQRRVAAPLAPTQGKDAATVSRVARALADRSAKACNVDKDDNWKIYGETYMDDARAAIAAMEGGKSS